jgi:CubicO group peptidase (beta-lactamase class C family)
MKKIYTVLFFLIFSLSQCFAQDISNIKIPKTLNELQDSIQKILIETNTLGAGIAMVSGDSVVLLRGFGKTDSENNSDVNPNTLFRLGSVSKLFVGLAILKLQEEGRLNLKDKVKDLIPDLKIINPSQEKHPIRVENLLEHTAGFSDWSLAELACNNPQIKTLKESLEYYPKGRIANYVPGTRTQYSNLGVSIAAYIVERVSGMPYDEYIDKYFFKAMGITDMSYVIRKNIKR